MRTATKRFSMPRLTLAIAGLIAAAPAAVPAQGLEEVLVTATRRTETNIQTTPISVTALSGDDFANYVPHDLNDIALTVPNLSGGQVAGFNSAGFAMRGVSQTSIILYQESPVGVLVDDFVLPHVQTQAIEAFDIESIEVLRGPQGTLFGKNTTAGTINVRTKRPELNSRSVEGKFLYGEFDTKEARFAGNYGADTFAFRVAGLWQKSDGYYENGQDSTDVFEQLFPGAGLGARFTGDGSDLGGDDVLSARFKALWQPADNFSALFQYELIRDNSDSPPIVNETPNDPLMAFSILGFPGVADDEDPLEHAGISERVVEEFGGEHEVHVDGFYLNLEWQPTDTLTVNSVTGYRDQKSRLASTYPGEATFDSGALIAPESLFDARRDDNRDTFQQELRLSSDFDGPWNFVAGAFYQKNDTKFCVLQVLGFLDYFSAFGAPTDPNTTLAALGLPTLTINNQDDNPSILCNRMDTDAYAVFTDMTVEFTDRITLGGGARMTYEKKKWQGRPQTYLQYLNGIAGFDQDFGLDDLGEPINAADFGAYPFNIYEHEKSWTEPAWRFTGSYQVYDNVFAWATIARGFKSGTYNDQTGTSLFFVPGAVIPERALFPVNPEIAESFEFGVKGDYFDNRLRLNAVYFDVTYSDAQRELVTVQGSFQETRFFNAAEIDARGIEVEGTLLLMDNLTFQAAASYQDVKYASFTADTNFDGVVDVDLSNSPVTRAPEWTASGSLTYTHETGWGSFMHNLNAAFESENIDVLSPVDPRFDGVKTDKVILNWVTQWTSSDGHYMARVFGKNLTDDRYRTGILPVAGLWTMTNFGAPRWFGFEVGANFDF
jgi:iron complex outermembrane receptor protein